MGQQIAWHRAAGPGLWLFTDVVSGTQEAGGGPFYQERSPLVSEEAERRDEPPPPPQSHVTCSPDNPEELMGNFLITLFVTKVTNKVFP